MKNVQILVVLALVALATASRVESGSQVEATTSYGSGYAWWVNLVLFSLRAANYNGCLFSTWVLAFFTNDGGFGFQACMDLLGQSDELFYGAATSNIVVLKYDA